MLNERILLPLLLIFGLTFLEIGFALPAFRTAKGISPGITPYNRKKLEKFINLLDKGTDAIGLRLLKKDILGNIELVIYEESKQKLVTNLIFIGTVLTGIIFYSLMWNIGQLWYVKILVASVCFILPYYALSLMFEISKYKSTKRIPAVIDEFRGAFLHSRKIRPALRETGKRVEKQMAGILLKAADAPDLEAGLDDIRCRYNNIWLNIFITLLLNHKDEGGELVNQLYKLNQTITRVTNIEKKRNKRLILYEIFTVSVCLFSIPIIFWINRSIMGSLQGSIIIDTRTNMVITRIIVLSLFSLVFIRILRRI